MTALQKYAWFNLAVIALTVAAIGLLIPVAGRGAFGGFGFLGLLGLGPLFFRQKPGKSVVMDERDVLIRNRSWTIAFSVFWAVGVAFAAFVSASVYGSEGSVPVWIVQSSVFVAMMLIYAMDAAAILVQYGRGGSHGE